MILFLCFKCSIALRTTGDPAEIEYLFIKSDWYPDKYPCPREGCGGTLQYVVATDSFVLPSTELHDLTPHEVFAAFNGLGMPDEHDCGETAVKQLFSKKITGIGTRQIRNTNRTVIEWIQFEGGEKLFLGSSSHGATAYRLSRPHSYTKAAS